MNGKSNGSTGNMKVHLECKHPDELPEDGNPDTEEFVSPLVEC